MEPRAVRGLFLLWVAVAAFGPPSPTEAPWTMRFNFNDGAVGGRVAGLDAAGGTAYITKQSSEGGKAARLTARRGEENFGRWGGRMPFPARLRKGDELWWRVRSFWPEGMDYSANPRLKFLRIHTGAADGGHWDSTSP